MEKSEFIQMAVREAKLFFTEFNLKSKFNFRQPISRDAFLWISTFPEVMSLLEITFQVPYDQSEGYYNKLTEDKIKEGKLFTITLIAVDKTDRKRDQFFCVDFTFLSNSSVMLESGLSTIYPKAGEEMLEIVTGQTNGHLYTHDETADKLSKICIHLLQERRFYEEYFDEYELKEYIQ